MDNMEIIGQVKFNFKMEGKLTKKENVSSLN
jgi:hypothetical protein